MLLCHSFVLCRLMCCVIVCALLLLCYSFALCCVMCRVIARDLLLLCYSVVLYRVMSCVIVVSCCYRVIRLCGVVLC